MLRGVSTLATEIVAVYARSPTGSSLDHAPIQPFVGRAFFEPLPNDLRILMVGVNAYVDDAEWSIAKPSPAWLKSWFIQGKYRFYPRAAKDAHELANGLAGVPFLRDKTFRGAEGMYVTNFVKTYVRTSLGKREDQLGDELASWSDHWADELELLAEHDVFPHPMVVYSRRVWNYAWRPLAAIQRAGCGRHAPRSCVHLAWDTGALCEPNRRLRVRYEATSNAPSATATSVGAGSNGFAELAAVAARV
jgi:hypothetical protein